MNCFNLLTCAISCLSLWSLLAEGYLGINWGRLATQRMIPSMVVDMLMQNKIKEVRIFSATGNVMEAFEGTGIGLSVTIPNEQLKFIQFSENADKWVYKYIETSNNSVSFRYVYIGTQPLSRTLFNKTYPESVEALLTAQKALNKKFKHVKATVDHLTDILKPVKKPSEGEFKDEVKSDIARSCKILQDNQAPIGLCIFPLLCINQVFDNDTEFAFFDNNSTSVFKDGDKSYSNIFEVMYDMYDVALERVGCPDMKIIISQIGWPTDGIKDGNIENAQRFHQGLAKFVASNKGTPRRPGRPMDVYIHNVADENAISRKAGPYMRHWGIYKFDGQPKFNVDFEGLGRKNQLVSAIGITHMPKRWCVYNNDLGPAENQRQILEEIFNHACNISDCTATEFGGSCSNLTFQRRISYGFNTAFQAKNQKASGNSCDYKGYGVIVSDDPSTPTCKFPVEILSAEIPNYMGILPNRAYALRPSSRSVISSAQMLFLVFILMRKF